MILVSDMQYSLHEEILAFCEYISPTTEERRMREDVIARITWCVKELWPSAEVNLLSKVRLYSNMRTIGAHFWLLCDRHLSPYEVRTATFKKAPAHVAFPNS